MIDAGFLRTDAVTAAQAALAAGVRFFQYRDKQGTWRQVHATAERLAPLLRAADALFLVNDHADIATAVGADGVHLGQDDLPIGHARTILGPERIIGISTHTVAQAIAAEREGADYIGFGPLFGTATKDAGPVQGIERLRYTTSHPLEFTQRLIDAYTRLAQRGAESVRGRLPVSGAAHPRERPEVAEIEWNQSPAPVARVLVNTFVAAFISSIVPIETRA